MSLGLTLIASWVEEKQDYIKVVGTYSSDVRAGSKTHDCKFAIDLASDLTLMETL